MSAKSRAFVKGEVNYMAEDKSTVFVFQNLLNFEEFFSIYIRILYHTLYSYTLVLSLRSMHRKDFFSICCNLLDKRNRNEYFPRSGNFLLASDRHSFRQILFCSYSIFNHVFMHSHFFLFNRKKELGYVQFLILCVEYPYNTLDVRLELHNLLPLKLISLKIMLVNCLKIF